MYTLMSGEPWQWHQDNRTDFELLVTGGNAVADMVQLHLNIGRARRLSMLLYDGEPCGTIAAKVPNPHYPKGITDRTGVCLADYPIEIGYLALMPFARSTHSVRLLFDGLIEQLDPHLGLWFTTSHYPKRAAAARGFRYRAHYTSERGTLLHLFTKEPR